MRLNLWFKPLETILLDRQVLCNSFSGRVPFSAQHLPFLSTRVSADPFIAHQPIGEVKMQPSWVALICEACEVNLALFGPWPMEVACTRGCRSALKQETQGALYTIFGSQCGLCKTTTTWWSMAKHALASAILLMFLPMASSESKGVKLAQIGRCFTWGSCYFLFVLDFAAKHPPIALAARTVVCLPLVFSSKW